eukprot:TRINITY_DN6245_c0_g1_i1.p1 TRINITY_DN6245_c0_g1~~TRINITY_DN6245_c0_g1_i1.p1  ORF type:complete len:520 (-),score=84.36 TRINITY_DN6245_c0_g1_i1:496-2055(-)
MASVLSPPSTSAHAVSYAPLCFPSSAGRNTFAQHRGTCMPSSSIAGCLQKSWTLHPSFVNGQRLKRLHGRKSVGVQAHMGELPPVPDIDSTRFLFESEGVKSIVQKTTSALFLLADTATAVAESDAKDDGGPFGIFTNYLESILKLLESGLSGLHVPYAYGFSIILLTLLVKLATLPLTKKQVESTLAMQNLAPKLKVIQERYKGDAERVQLETARLYKQAGVNPLAGCLPTLATLPVWIGLYRALTNVANEGLLTEGFFWIPSLAGPTTMGPDGQGTAWLFPFVDGHPPLGWADTAAYLVLPVVLVISQFVSMKIMQPVQSDDPSQKQSQAILKFLPFMIGWFSLSVPSGLSLYWLTNNVLSTAQQVILKKLGGATPAMDVDVGGIIDAGKAKRSGVVATPSAEDEARAARFKALKEAESAKKAARLKAAEEASKAAAAEAVKQREQMIAAEQQRTGATSVATQSESESEDGAGDDHASTSSDTSTLGKVSSPSTNGSTGSTSVAPKLLKRSKRKRTA